MDHQKDKLYWSPIEKKFLNLVKEHTILYETNARKSNTKSAPQVWKAISEEMSRSGHLLKPKSCRDKFQRIRKKFEKVYKMSKVDKSVLHSRFLDGTLSFLEKEVEKKITPNIDCLQEEQVARQERSNDSVTGFQFPAISLLSSDSESESTESIITGVYKNYELSIENNKGTEMISSTNIPWTESEKRVIKPTETITSKTIVSLEMIEALLKSKIDSSNANTVGSIFPDDASDTAANLSRTLPIVDQTNADKPSVDEASNDAFTLNAGPASFVVMPSHTIKSTQVNRNKISYTNISQEEIASSVIMPSHTNTSTEVNTNTNNYTDMTGGKISSSVMMPSHTITSAEVNTNKINYTDISEEEINSNTASKNRDFIKASASSVNVVKKEITSIFDINSEGDDIEVFLNEVAGYMSNSYSLERQMDIRFKISELVTAAEKGEMDQQCNFLSTNIIRNENLALEQLSGIKHHLATRSHVYDVYDLGSDSDSSV